MNEATKVSMKQITAAKTGKVMPQKQKNWDRTTSARLSPIAYKQLSELQDSTGENASRVIIRAIGVLHDKLILNSVEIKKTKRK